MSECEFYEASRLKNSLGRVSVGIPDCVVEGEPR